MVEVKSCTAETISVHVLELKKKSPVSNTAMSPKFKGSSGRLDMQSCSGIHVEFS